MRPKNQHHGALPLTRLSVVADSRDNATLLNSHLFCVLCWAGLQFDYQRLLLYCLSVLIVCIALFTVASNVMNKFKRYVNCVFVYYSHLKAWLSMAIDAIEDT